MTFKLTAFIVCGGLLSACGAHPVQISNDRCWNVETGDRVEGSVTIVGIIDDALVEGGSAIQNKACPEKTMGLAIPPGPILDAYRKAMTTIPPRFVERRFHLTGRVSQIKSTGRLLVEADGLRAIP